MDIDAETGKAVAPSDNLPGMGPMLSAYVKMPRTWSAAMAVVLARKGEDGLLDEVTDELLEGSSLKAIAEGMGLRVGELGRFLYLHEEAYRGMMRVKADLLAHETLGIADSADAEDVAVAKLRIDTRFKLASKWDKVTYGDKDTQIGIGISPAQAGSGGIQITFVDASEGRRVE